MRGKKILVGWREGSRYKMTYFEGKSHFLDKETKANGEKLTCYTWTS